MKRILLATGIILTLLILSLYALQAFFERYELVAPIVFQNPIQKRMLSPLPINPNTIIDVKKIQEQIEKQTQKDTNKHTTPRGGNVGTIRGMAIRKVLQTYNPNISYLADFIEKETAKYPIYKKYPYLIPSIVIKETTAGKHMAYQNNLTNWGITVGLECPTYEFCLERTISGIGERTSFYDEFRKTGDLYAFLNVYAPPTSNDTKKYYADMQFLFNEFEQNE